MSSTNFYQSVIQGTWVNNKKKPLDDPRVRRALHLVFDRSRCWSTWSRTWRR
jgi:ABC-type oligopeptide transport system, periplasmic component